jgi:hypothetical protein
MLGVLSKNDPKSHFTFVWTRSIQIDPARKDDRGDLGGGSPPKAAPEKTTEIRPVTPADPILIP